MSIYDELSMYADLKEFVNVEEGMGRVRDNAMLYKKILGSFLSSAYFEDFCTQVQNGDSAAVATIHTIKGLTANLSLPKSNQLCIQIEQKLKNGEDVKNDLPNMVEVMNKTKTYVEAVINKV